MYIRIPKSTWARGSWNFWAISFIQLLMNDVQCVCECEINEVQSDNHTPSNSKVCTFYILNSIHGLAFHRQVGWLLERRES